MPPIRQPIPTGQASQRRADRWFLTALGAITLLALALRFYQLGYESLDMDELVQVRGYSQSPWGLFLWAAVMGQPILDYLIGALMWRTGLAETDMAVRIPAALFGTGSVLLLGLWARRIAGRSVGFASAMFLAVCPFHIILSQQARQYTIFVFFALATLMVFDRARRVRNTQAWVLFSTTLFALLMTRWVGPHVITIAIVGYTVAMWAVAHRSAEVIAIHREKQNLFATTAAMAAPYFISIPMYAMIILQSRGAVSLNLTDCFVRAWTHLADGYLATLAGFSASTVFGPHAPEGWFVTATMILVIIGSIQLTRRAFADRNRHAEIFLAALVSFPVVFAAVYACLTGALAKPQYLLLMVLPICVCLALAAKSVRDTVAVQSALAGEFAFAAIVAGITLTMYSASLGCLDTQDKRDWRAAMTYLREHASENDAFAVAGSDAVPAAFVPLAYGKHRYGIPQAKFLPIRQTTNASALTEQKWSNSATTTWLLVYTDRMYLGYDHVRAPVTCPASTKIHRFNGLFLIESRAENSATVQLMDAIALLYTDLPAARSLIAPAMLRARYLQSIGQYLAARESFDQAIRQCRNPDEVTALEKLIASDFEILNSMDARASANGI